MIESSVDAGPQLPGQATGQTPRPVIGIDASRNRSGGAKTHILGILAAVDPREFGIEQVHVWSYDKLLRALPDAAWLVKHGPPELERSLPNQLWWQYRQLPRELERYGCNVLLSTDAGSVCRFSPSIVMSRDMLSFEGKEMQRYGLLTFSRLRLFLLRHMQVGSLRRATGALFLTRYASDVIQQFTGALKSVRVIPHGIGEHFRQQTASGGWSGAAQPIRCVYVSNADLYKHQWHVVRAIASLRKAGHPVALRLVGGGSGPARRLLDQAIAEEDPTGAFVQILEAVPHDAIPAQLAMADIFIFASSCENMPNTLVEAMAAGLPIACSNRGPMPEILQDAGAYFDPEDPASIAAAIATLLDDSAYRTRVAKKAKTLSDQYSWTRCATQTWTFLADVWTEHTAHRLAPPDTHNLLAAQCTRRTMR
jgi:glycosyltransferase involved in cell wall biosynthesis